MQKQVIELQPTNIQTIKPDDTYIVNDEIPIVDVDQNPASLNYIKVYRDEVLDRARVTFYNPEAPSVVQDASVQVFQAESEKKEDKSKLVKAGIAAAILYFTFAG